MKYYVKQEEQSETAVIAIKRSFFYKTVTNNVFISPPAHLPEHIKAGDNGRQKSLVWFLTHPLSEREMLGIYTISFLENVLYCLPHGPIMSFQRDVGEHTRKSLKHDMI